MSVKRVIRVLLRDAAADRVIVPSDSIQFSFNVQHDCQACGCDAVIHIIKAMVHLEIIAQSCELGGFF
ncbi:hypothetical protein B0H13DRAFT_2381420 [Mycena leptocephala]|nr:hypothetical protein B0H13DRAFT_2381420 [Mycena leptocephala]